MAELLPKPPKTDLPFAVLATPQCFADNNAPTNITSYEVIVGEADFWEKSTSCNDERQECGMDEKVK